MFNKEDILILAIYQGLALLTLVFLTRYSGKAKDYSPSFAAADFIGYAFWYSLLSQLLFGLLSWIFISQTSVQFSMAMEEMTEPGQTAFSPIILIGVCFWLGYFFAMLYFFACRYNRLSNFIKRFEGLEPNEREVQLRQLSPARFRQLPGDYRIITRPNTISPSLESEELPALIKQQVLEILSGSGER